MGGTFSKIQSTVGEMRGDIAVTLAAITNTVNDFRHDASGTMANLANECFECLHMITRRADYTAFLLTNAVLAIAATIALSLLLRLTNFSPFLRGVVWIMFAGLCLHMVLTYLRHSCSPSLPTSQQQEVPIRHQNPKLEKIIAQSTIHSEVDLTKRQLIDEDMEIVVTEAIINKECTKLRLGWNRITSTGASSLADALLNNNTLEELSLWKNCMYDLGIQYLAETLSINKNTLRRLDLSANGITDTGAAHLAQMLKTNKILTHLSLSSNEITDQGVVSLSAALQNRNHTLEVLSLSENKLLSDSIVNALIDMFKNNHSLRKLWLNDCNLSQKSQDRLRTVAKSKKEFKVYL